MSFQDGLVRPGGTFSSETLANPRILLLTPTACRRPHTPVGTKFTIHFLEQPGKRREYDGHISSELLEPAGIRFEEELLI